MTAQAGWLPAKVGYGGFGSPNAPIAVQAPLTPVLTTWSEDGIHLSAVSYACVRDGGEVDTEKEIILLHDVPDPHWAAAVVRAKQIVERKAGA